MDLFLYLFVASAIFLILSLYLFISALSCSYKYGSWKGLLLCLGLGALSPAALLIFIFCLWVSVLFMEKPFPGKTVTVTAIFFIAWIIGNLLSWGVVIKNGIKNQKKIQMKAGIYGLSAAASFVAALLCFMKFGCNAT